MSDDTYLDVEARMTDGQRAEFLRRTHAMFPSMRGANVSDVLDILSDNDWECGAIEATFDANAEWFVGLDAGAVHAALIAAKIMCCDPRQTVYSLVGGPST